MHIRPWGGVLELTLYLLKTLTRHSIVVKCCKLWQLSTSSVSDSKGPLKDLNDILANFILSASPSSCTSRIFSFKAWWYQSARQVLRWRDPSYLINRSTNKWSCFGEHFSAPTASLIAWPKGFSHPEGPFFLFEVPSWLVHESVSSPLQSHQP